MNLELKEYVLQNYQSMTAQELAASFKVPVTKVQSVLQYLGLKALAPSERIKGYMKEHPDLSAQELADLFKRTPSIFYQYAKELGIKLRTPVSKVKKESEWLSQEQAAEADRELENFEWRPDIRGKMIEMGVFTPAPKKRIKDTYTQSSSPFGLADEVRNIKLK